MATTQSNFKIGDRWGLRIRTWWSERIYPGHARFSGLNAYVADDVIGGRARPPRQTQFGIGLEFAFDPRWVLAVDVLRSRTVAARAVYTVRGDGGIVTFDSHAPAAAQMIVAPALEYNWSPFSGVIGGVSVVTAGVNVPSTLSVQFAYSHVF